MAPSTGGFAKKRVYNIRAFVYRDSGVAPKASVRMANVLDENRSPDLPNSNYGSAAVFGDMELTGS
jgi:hypothetical protein